MRPPPRDGRPLLPEGLEAPAEPAAPQGDDRVGDGPCITGAVEPRQRREETPQIVTDWGLETAPQRQPTGLVLCIQPDWVRLQAAGMVLQSAILSRRE